MVTSPADRSSKFPSSELCRSSFLFRDFEALWVHASYTFLDKERPTLEQSPVEHTAEIWVSGPNPYGQREQASVRAVEFSLAVGRSLAFASLG